MLKCPLNHLLCCYGGFGWLDALSDSHTAKITLYSDIALKFILTNSFRFYCLFGLKMHKVLILDNIVNNSSEIEHLKTRVLFLYIKNL